MGQHSQSHLLVLLIFLLLTEMFSWETFVSQQNIAQNITPPLACLLPIVYHRACLFFKGAKHTHWALHMM